MPDLDDALSPALEPKADELGAEFPKGDDDTVVFCCVGVPEDDAKGEAPIFNPVFPNPEDGAGADGTSVDPSFPNPDEDDKTPAVEAAEVDRLDISCKGFGTLYLLDSF